MEAIEEKLPLLDVKGVSKAFPGVQPLNQVDFEVFPREIAALLGDHGAGKSTLMKNLSGVFKPDEGSIDLNGRRIHPQNPPEEQIWGIAILYQKFNLIPDQSVTTNKFLSQARAQTGIQGRLGFVDYGTQRGSAAAHLNKVGARFRRHKMPAVHQVSNNKQIVEGRRLTI